MIEAVKLESGWKVLPYLNRWMYPLSDTYWEYSHTPSMAHSRVVAAQKGAENQDEGPHVGKLPAEVPPAEAPPAYKMPADGLSPKEVIAFVG